MILPNTREKNCYNKTSNLFRQAKLSSLVDFYKGGSNIVKTASLIPPRVKMDSLPNRLIVLNSFQWGIMGNLGNFKKLTPYKMRVSYPAKKQINKIKKHT